MEDGPILLFLESHRGRWEQCHSGLCGRGITDCRCDRTPRCHLHLLFHCMLLEVPFLGVRFFLPLGGRLLTCQHPAGYQSTQGECEEHSTTQNDMTWHSMTPRGAAQFNTIKHETIKKQHNTDRQKQWNNVTQHGSRQKGAPASTKHTRPAVVTESGRSRNWCQKLFTRYSHIKWHFQGGSRADTHQCGIWGNWKQGHWVCSESLFVLLFTVAAAQQQLKQLSNQTVTSLKVNRVIPNNSRSALGQLRQILQSSFKDSRKFCRFKWNKNDAYC